MKATTLIRHITRHTGIPETELDFVHDYVEPASFRKKQMILDSGKSCTANYFVASGCLRLGFVNDKGTELTTQFAIENWWLTDNMAYMRGTPSEFFIRAVEKSEVLILKRTEELRLLKEHPGLERYFRIVYETAGAAAQRRIQLLYSMSKEELYRHFHDHYPEFARRVPQYLLASFLGFTPEYLSELRRRK